jgi:surfeit locus 1 family protein
MKTLKTIFNRKWWWVTLVVIAACLVMARLGWWQIERLDQRRAFNATVAERWREAPYDIIANDLPDDLEQLEFRRVQVAGTFDYDNEVVLLNQTRANMPGVVLATPLVTDDGRAVLVARGWVPYSGRGLDELTQYRETDAAPIVGILQESQNMPGGNPVPVPATPQAEWHYLNIPAIQPQMPYELLPMLVLQMPEAGRAADAFPLREEPVELLDSQSKETMHMSYAVQWFMFAVILAFGYIQFVIFTERRAARIAAAELQSSTDEHAEPDDLDLPPVAHGV